MSSPIILALDTTLQKAHLLLSQVRPYIGMIKIGLGMWSEYGKECLNLGQQYNVPLFLDLNLHDTPDTIASATDKLCQQLSNIRGQHFLSLHCFGGAKMVAAAKKIADCSNVEIVGTTLLTSLDENDLHHMGCRDCRPGIRTVDLILSARNTHSPITHFVCAPNHVALVKKHWQNLVVITPGIRFDTENENDHKRTKSISFALKNGVDWVVIGRPITESYDPVLAAEAFKNHADKFRY
jgi:orotidine-5'-phosphate decarboxylase